MTLPCLYLEASGKTGSLKAVTVPVADKTAPKNVPERQSHTHKNNNTEFSHSCFVFISASCSPPRTFFGFNLVLSESVLHHFNLRGEESVVITSLAVILIAKA